MRVQNIRFAALAFAVCLSVTAFAPLAPAQAQATQGPVKITLDDAIQLALQHNHTILATRTNIQQSRDQEITANLRPNPVFLVDEQYMPFFSPDAFNKDYINQSAVYDMGLSYLVERGKKRQHRLGAAQDLTAVTTSQVADSERSLTFQVASEYINVEVAESTLDLAQQDLQSFQNSVDISQQRYRAGDISEDDYLKIHLQLLQFQTDASQAQLAKIQALSDLRHLLGYESVPADFDVAGPFDYFPLNANLEDLQAKALASRPDLRAAQQGVTAANSQYTLAKANGKKDLGVTFTYNHLGGVNTGSLFFNIQMPLFDRNQGEIARTQVAITQAQEQQKAASEQVLTDVEDAYEGLHTNDQVVQLYRSGYLDEAQQDRDISQYAYQRGAASLLDYLDAERSYRATQLAYRQSLAAYLLALEQLREAVGTRSLP
jgi:cobalt-zinc-cadmium efflux system outer membrane protein